MQYAREILEQQGEERRAVLGDEGGGGAEPLRSAGGKGDAGRGPRKKNPGDKPAPYLGYFYKILKKQGPNAPGGPIVMWFGKKMAVLPWWPIRRVRGYGGHDFYGQP